MLHSGNTYLNIIETVMFDSPFASKLHGYVELSCTDSHKFTHCSSIERQRCHTIWIFYLNLVLSKFHKGFSILSVYFGFCFVWLCFILVCVNFFKFRKGKYKLLFMHFTVVQKVEGDRCCEISKHSASYSNLLEPTAVFLSQWVDRFYMRTTKPNCRSRSEPKSSPFYVNKCKQTKSFVAVSWTPKRQFVENERQLHKIHACKRSSLLSLFFPTIKCYTGF